MSGLQQLADDVAVERVEYDETVVTAADFGVGADLTVDVLGDTCIVVADGQQYEFDLPASDAEVFNRNGVLTVEVKR